MRHRRNGFAWRLGNGKVGRGRLSGLDAKRGPEYEKMLESTRWVRACRYPDRDVRAEHRDDTNRETTNPDLELVARLARQKGASTELTDGHLTYPSPTTLLESGELIKTSQADAAKQ